MMSRAFCQRASAAFFANLDRSRALNAFIRFNPPLRDVSCRCSAVNAFARAKPPFLPPSRPSATAAGFFVSFCFLDIPFHYITAR